MENVNINNKVLYLPIDKILPNPYQPRKDFSEESLKELCSSIKAYGVIQPISVRKKNEEDYELVAGERRLRASKLAGLDLIPAIVVEMSDEDSAVVALIENLQREDLNFFEEAEGYYKLINNHGFTQQELAEKVGKNQSTIANKLRILKLEDKVKEIILNNKLTERHARALLKLPDEQTRLEILQVVVKKNLNVKKTEKLIKNKLEELSKPQQPERNQTIKSALNFRIYLNTLKNAYNAIVNTGLKAEYEQIDQGEYIKVVVKIPKNQ
ncbi:chromosome partitioning protein, ParB family [Caminicella sporogenes DSM 14501]|uniref:Chromosome partitioning protein, ParB family n=1 Tax=Caminicella sporogenes DSM 14501 TaxID=1121266 RepID=A0A1M6ND36_9FIRM|nr:nucleoid occlusion protein [Caminicella sporogenes]RKD22242.1 nucleoid occlusion protein [Caminicella sporogenes]WIF95870.1 nucleoid occlusion protein [Caminicella sporogenes]SHJ93529.1 chromosome partitioning protein, ParB family [Caminicella sporogenes DSM 14501]